MSQLNSNFQLANAFPLVSPIATSRSQSKTIGNRIRLRDWRDLYLLIGECRNTGADGRVWRRHLTQRLRDFLDADIVSFMDCDLCTDAEQLGDQWLPTSKVTSGNWDGCTNATLDWLFSTISQSNTFLPNNQTGSRVRVASRNDLARLFNQSVRSDRGDETSIAAGDFVLSAHRHSQDQMQILVLLRTSDRPCFERRVMHLIRSLWIELCHFQPDELKALESSVFHKYPKRMLQVVACLLAGSTAKETAQILEVSVHTVQEHIKRLYKRTGTTNRAELAEHFRDDAPQLIDTPLDQFPNCR